MSWNEDPRLYAAAMDACHSIGLPWTDPRTGKTHKAPRKKTRQSEIREGVMSRYFVPETPAGSLCVHLASKTVKEAIKKLLVDASHMPYEGWIEFEDRGYRIVEMPKGWKP